MVAPLSVPKCHSIGTLGRWVGSLQIYRVGRPACGRPVGSESGVDRVTRVLDEIGGMVSVISNPILVPPALRRVRCLSGELRVGKDGPHPRRFAASRTCTRLQAQLASRGDSLAKLAFPF